MTVTPLSESQSEQIEMLVRSGRLRRVPVDKSRAREFLANANERIAAAAEISSAFVAHGIAYDAAHDVGEAFLAAYGLATTNGNGQHAAIGEFLRIVLDTPPELVAAAQGFDRARRTRNQQNYQAQPVGRAQADLTKQIAIKLLQGARRFGIGE